MSAVLVRLIVERNAKLTDGFNVADDFGQIEWCAEYLQQKAFLVELLRELAREQRPAPTDEETIGRLQAAVDLLEADAVDVHSVATVVRGTIRALGGRA